MLLARITLLGLALVLPAILIGQAIAATPPALKMCELVQRPEQFSGKLISVRGRVQIGFEDFELSVAECGSRNIQSIWLEYGKGPKRQPTTWCCGAMVPTDSLVVIENDAFRTFDRYLIAQSRAHLHSVTATLTGRFDTKPTQPCPDGKSQCCNGGFGHMGAFCARLVIQSVSEVEGTPIVPAPGGKGR
jgi:hypothetical protein